MMMMMMIMPIITIIVDLMNVTSLCQGEKRTTLLQMCSCTAVCVGFYPNGSLKQLIGNIAYY